MSQNQVIVGIDLGTTFSCCYYFNQQTGKYEIIRFMSGEYTIPSCVDFNKRPVVTGVPSPLSIAEVKRIIGLKYDDPKVQDEISENKFNFIIQEDANGFCEIEFQPTYSNQVFRLKPEDVSAIVLRGIKTEICKALRLDNDTEIHAIVTVPAYFDDDQKDSTRLAAEMSNFKLIAMLQEPSAAAYAYYKTRGLKDGYYLAFDLGGGTFDLTLMKVNGEDTKFLGTSGDTHLGGMDFDKCFMDRILEIWEEEDPKENLVHLFRIHGKDTKAVKVVKQQRIFKLRKIAEKAKIELSKMGETEIDLSEFYDGEEYYLPLTRQDFEDCNQHYFDRCIELTNALLRKKNVKRGQIKEVILIGGSSQIPKVQEMLRAQFTQARLNNDIDCNYVVAMGACMAAKDKRDNGLIPLDGTTAHQILIKGLKGNMPLVREDTALPHQHEFYVEVKGTEAYSEIFEEKKDPLTEATTLKPFGRFTIHNIPKGDRYCAFVVTIESDGVLRIEGRFSNGQRVRVGCEIQRKSTRGDAAVQEGLQRIRPFCPDF